jgi:hypothetical protein
MRRQIGVSSYLLLPGNLLPELGGLLPDGLHHRPLSTTSPWKLLEWPVGDGGGEEWKGVEVRSESRSKLGRRSCRRGARPGDTLPVPMARGGPLLRGRCSTDALWGHHLHRKWGCVPSAAARGVWEVELSARAAAVGAPRPGWLRGSADSLAYA